MKISKILISQPRPAVVEKSPFHDLSLKYGLTVDYTPLIKVVGVTPKDFRSQRIDILSHSAVIFTSRTTIDSFFRICEDARVTVPETMKYICNTEAVALYLQKYIVYRKRKIFFADGSFNGIIELVVKHRDEKFLLALSEPHKPEMPEALERLGIDFDRVILARTVPADIEGLDITSYDMLLLYSPWDVTAIKDKFDGVKLPPIATFGQGTLRAALEAGLGVRINAPTPEAPSLVKAVELYCQRVANGEEIPPVTLADNAETEEFLRTQQSKLSKRSRVRVTADKR
ncbi:MAG: uroporphyrinogen-III synthase [Alistipes sp.]|nr:uroporphyrinogen-III synthase [Alistipes sp.]